MCGIEMITRNKQAFEMLALMALPVASTVLSYNPTSLLRILYSVPETSVDKRDHPLDIASLNS